MTTPANHKQVLEYMGICRIHENALVSPIVWGVTQGSTSKYTQWTIYVALKSGKITADMITDRSYTGTAVYWTIFGQVGGTMTESSKTVVDTGKNTGKANFTTPLTQAVLKAKSLFSSKLRAGGSLNKDSLYLPGSTVTFSQLANSGECGWRVFPMALHDISKSNNWRHIKFPAMIQPKYDGTRFIVVNRGTNLDGYSRGQKTYDGQDHILTSLKPVLAKYPGLYLDGELYKAGMNLQNISGNSRRSDSDVKLDFYVFDCFKIDEPQMPFINRADLLRKILKPLPEYIKIVPTKSVASREQTMEIFNNHLKLGYEGSVIRNRDSLYEFGINSERRSYTTLKIKPFNDDEWILCGFNCGIGKDTDAIKWILTVTPETIAQHSEKYNMPNIRLPDEADRIFDAVSKGVMGSMDSRRALYKFLSTGDYFEKHLRGQEMTVQFSILSEYGKPQQPKVLGFRDKRVEEKLLRDAGL